MADNTNAEVVDFPGTYAPDAEPETVAVAPEHAEAVKGDHQRQPIVPEQCQRHNIRSTVSYLAGLHWHRARFHGLRSPAYLARCVFYAVRGGARLTGRLARWAHWTDGWKLESMAVAAGRAGHLDAIRAHEVGKKTRRQRFKILGVLAAIVLAGILAVVAFAPLWVWVAVALPVVATLVYHGRPVGKPIVKPAVVAPVYQPPTPEIITRTLGSLNIAQINAALKDGGHLTFVTDVHRDGPGWGVQYDAPFGVLAEMILAKPSMCQW